MMTGKNQVSLLFARLWARGKAKSSRSAFFHWYRLVGDTLSGGPVSSPPNTRYRFNVGRLPGEKGVDYPRILRTAELSRLMYLSRAWHKRRGKFAATTSQFLATDGTIFPRDFRDNWKSLEHNRQLDHRDTTCCILSFCCPFVLSLNFYCFVTMHGGLSSLNNSPSVNNL